MTRERKRILIVDDESDVAFTLKVILEKHGFIVDYFTDSTTAMQQFKPDSYDLVILDIKMPKLNGFELYDNFEEKDAKIKALFLTALSNVESYDTDKDQVYPLKGERHFLRKPISSDELLEQVYSLID